MSENATLKETLQWHVVESDRPLLINAATSLVEALSTITRPRDGYVGREALEPYEQDAYRAALGFLSNQLAEGPRPAERHVELSESESSAPVAKTAETQD